jgi:hypothetical protein
MNKLMISMGIATVVGIAAVGLMANADEDHDEGYEHGSYGGYERDDQRSGGSGGAYLADTSYKLYQTECGSCHLAYPPFMLPAASWQGMMGSLADHFGDNAELDPATAGEISAFLARNAAGSGGGELGERTWRATRGQTPPLRITATDYFRGQHHEIPAKMVANNPQVASFSRCETCHGGAERGDFAEHGVRIPGYGRWDD